jgi:hypothetical protein
VPTFSQVTRTILLALVLTSACSSEPPPDGSDAGVRYPRLGLRCTCEPQADHTTPCESEQCGDGVMCFGSHCGIGCETSGDCPAGAWCNPGDGFCVWSCSYDADCVDPDVNYCAPIGTCFER